MEKVDTAPAPEAFATEWEPGEWVGGIFVGPYLVEESPVTFPSKGHALAWGLQRIVDEDAREPVTRL